MEVRGCRPLTILERGLTKSSQGMVGGWSVLATYGACEHRMVRTPILDYPDIGS